jgi:sporulation protein YlmC with PRC-barrel domain
MGRQLHAIPWSALQTALGGEYYVPVTAEQLSGTRGFSSSQWPSSPERGWLLGETPEDTEYRNGTQEENRRIQSRRASRIFGISVKDPQGRSVATIRDLVIEMDSGQLLYTVVSTGGMLGLGNQYAAIPPEAIEFWPDQRVARISVSEELRRTLTNQWPDSRRDLHGVPSGVRCRAGLGRARICPSRRGRTAGDDQARDGPGSRTGATMPEAEQSHFSADMTRIQGSSRMGIFRPAQGGPETLRLRLKTNEGKLITVHLAPRDYISKQDFYVVSGDNVSVTGAELRIGRQSVFLAADVTRDGQTLRLRDANGRPLWLRSGESAESTDERSAETGRASEYTGQYPETDM